MSCVRRGGGGGACVWEVRPPQQEPPGAGAGQPGELRPLPGVQLGDGGWARGPPDPGPRGPHGGRKLPLWRHPQPHQVIKKTILHRDRVISQ